MERFILAEPVRWTMSCTSRPVPAAMEPPATLCVNEADGTSQGPVSGNAQPT